MIPNNNGMVKKTDYNTKIAEVQNKIPSVTGLANTAAINTKTTEIENKNLSILIWLLKPPWVQRQRMRKAAKYLVSKIQVDMALDTVDEKRKKSEV